MNTTVALELLAFLVADRRLDEEGSTAGSNTRTYLGITRYVRGAFQANVQRLGLGMAFICVKPIPVVEADRIHP